MLSVLMRLLVSRKVWIALAGVAGSIITTFGADEEKWTPIISAIVGLAGLLIAAIGYEDAARNRVTGGNVINGASRTLPLLLIALLASASLGCAATPEARYWQARDTLNQTQNAIVVGNQIDVISDEDFVALDPIAQGARKALERAKSQLPAGGETFEYYLDLAESILDQLSKFNPNMEATDGSINGSGIDNRDGAGERGGNSRGPAGGKNDERDSKRSGELGAAADFAAQPGGIVHAGSDSSNPERGGNLRRQLGRSDRGGAGTHRGDGHGGNWHRRARLIGVVTGHCRCTDCRGESLIADCGSRRRSWFAPADHRDRRSPAPTAA